MALLQSRATAHGVQRHLLHEAQRLLHQVSQSLHQPMAALRDRDTGRVYETKEGELCFRPVLNIKWCPYTQRPFRKSDSD